MKNPSSARNDLATQCPRVVRKDRMRMPALCIMFHPLCAITSLEAPSSVKKVLALNVHAIGPR